MVHPPDGSYPGVIIWPDILGLRPAFIEMGRRLANSGYAVLVVNPFYRSARAPVVPEGATFNDPAVRETVFPLAGARNASHLRCAGLHDHAAVVHVLGFAPERPPK
jgi:carboxymethylenebutenolidase